MLYKNLVTVSRVDFFLYVDPKNLLNYLYVLIEVWPYGLGPFTFTRTNVLLGIFPLKPSDAFRFSPRGGK